MASLIKSLALKNFKGFSDEVRIDLRRITLLFGANSVGKSSVLQAMQLMREVLERGDANVDRTTQGGDTIDVGGFRNFVHNRDVSRSISVAVDMELGDESIPDLFDDVIEVRSDVDPEVRRFHETLNLIRNQVRTVAVKLILSWSEFRNQAVVSGYRVDFNDDWCAEVMTDLDGQQPRLRLNVKHPIFIVAEIEGEMLFEEVAKWVFPPSMGSNSFRAELGMSTEKVENEDPEPIPNSVLLEILEVVRAAFADSPNPGFATWLNSFQGALPRLDKPFLIPADQPETTSNVFVLQEFSAFMYWLLIGPAQLLRDQLRQLRYIGPLRRIPPRGFDVSLTKNDAAWSDGMAAWETLLTGSQDLVTRVSDWMQSPDKLATGYAVTRKQTQEFDIAQPVPQPVGPIRKRVHLVDAAGRAHQPQDVGVGISQVLPVVVAAQDGSASVVCIEQPELHIHPAVQVGLGDLFIDGALNQELSFLIETHSEHLVMRLQRRLREAATGELPEGQPAIDPSMVSMLYLGRSESGAVTVTPIGLTAQGKFDTSWPDGFFPERTTEVLPAKAREQLQAARRERKA